MENSPKCAGIHSTYPTIQMALLLALSFIDAVTETSYGPTLPALQCKYGVNLQTINLLFPIYSATKTVGSVLHIPIRRILGGYQLISTCALIASVFLIALPLCPTFWLAVGTSSVLGLSSGIGTSARLAKIGESGENNAIHLHLLMLSIAVGDASGPLFIAPFLGNTFCSNETHNRNAPSVVGEKSDSNLHYAFLGFGIVGVTFSVALAVLQSRLKHESKPEVSHDPTDIKQFGYSTRSFVLTLMLFIFVGGSTSFVYSTLLSLYGTHSVLQIPEQTMALMTSSFAAMMVIGRAGGAVLTLVLSQFSLTVVCLNGLVVSAVLLLLAAEHSVVFLWTASLMLALWAAPLFASVMAWATVHVKMTDTLYAVVMFANQAGIATETLIIGQLMADYEPRMLLFCVLALALLQTICFVVLALKGRVLKRNYTLVNTD